MTTKISNSFKTGMPELINQAVRKRQYIEITSTVVGKTVAFDAFITKMAIGATSGAEPYSHAMSGVGNVYAKPGAVVRTIDMGFKTVSSSTANAQANLQKLGILYMFTFPTFNVSEGVASRSEDNEIRLKFMNLVQGAKSSNVSTISENAKGVKAYIRDLT